MSIVMIGTGYVGLVSGACLAELGKNVICVDKETDKIQKLKQGIMPIFEEGLEDMVASNVSVGRLSFTTNLKDAVQNATVIFLAVGTPLNEADGSADLSHLFAATEEIAEHLTSDCIIVVKSTVPVGTGFRVNQILKKQRPEFQCQVVSNPEFLRQGRAVYDFMNPDRIVVGAESSQAHEMMQQLYAPLTKKNFPLLCTDIKTSELIKYASNAFLATKVAYINQLADVCEVVGADIDDLATGMGMDQRIGDQFLKPGPGFGGSCLLKDTSALVKSAKDVGVDLSIIQDVITANETRKRTIAQKVLTAFDDNIQGKNIAILGLTFKAGTDDLRDSPSLVVIPELQQAGAHIRTFDPQGMDEAKKFLDGNINWCDSIEEAIAEADAVVILTEWQEFKTYDLKKLRAAVKQPLVIDLRNIYSAQEMAELGIRYIAIGKKPIAEVEDNLALAS